MNDQTKEIATVAATLNRMTEVARPYADNIARLANSVMNSQANARLLLELADLEQLDAAIAQVDEFAEQLAGACAFWRQARRNLELR